MILRKNAWGWKELNFCDRIKKTEKEVNFNERIAVHYIKRKP